MRSLTYIWSPYMDSWNMLAHKLPFPACNFSFLWEMVLSLGYVRFPEVSLEKELLWTIGVELILCSSELFCANRPEKSDSVEKLIAAGCDVNPSMHRWNLEQINDITLNQESWQDKLVAMWRSWLCCDVNLNASIKSRAFSTKINKMLRSMSCRLEEVFERVVFCNCVICCFLLVLCVVCF